MSAALRATFVIARSSACIALALAVAACKPSGGQPAGGFPPPVVAVATVETRDIPVTYEYVAQTEGSREVEVRARVTGILQKRNFVEGALVKQGQSLFTIDPAPFRVALERAEGELAVAEARLAQAQREADRLKPVIESRAVSRKELDDAISAAEIAEAEVRSARARVSEAKLNVEYTRVEAPISGISSRANVSEGTLVSGPNVLLASVTQTDPIYVIFGIPDRDYLAMRRDSAAGRLRLPQEDRFRARVRLADGTVYAQSGMLNFRDVRVNSRTGTSEARAVLPNPQGSLRAGEFVRVILDGAVRPAAVVVPLRSVLEGPQGKFVYVVNAESKAEPRPVEVGEWTAEGWVIHKGLQPGERVIVDGVMKLGPGSPVKVASDASDPGTPADKKPSNGAQTPAGK
ncbi:MAG TPA: efflux RND transporter periplasmic adaptor subunit [Burkholderiales bacterium]|nr:efflux RND transporter periplasmic adaptor subunit [Burkholderiales bacterium]